MYEVSVEQSFASAHALRNYRGGCENVHGHNFRVQISVQGEHLDETGLLVDFLEVQNLMGEVIGRLDHQFLNEVSPFDEINPSAENIAKYFYDRISSGLTNGAVRVAEVRIWETDSSSALYRP